VSEAAASPALVLLLGSGSASPRTASVPAGALHSQRLACELCIVQFLHGCRSILYILEVNECVLALHDDFSDRSELLEWYSQVVRSHVSRNPSHIDLSLCIHASITIS